MSLPAYLTAKELAAHLKLAPKFGNQVINRWVREGRFKNIAVKVANKWLFPEDKIQEWVESGRMQ